MFKMNIQFCQSVQIPIKVYNRDQELRGPRRSGVKFKCLAFGLDRNYVGLPRGQKYAGGLSTQVTI